MLFKDIHQNNERTGKKNLNQDSNEEIPPATQNPNLEENIDDYIRQIMEDTQKKTGPTIGSKHPG